VAGFRLQGKGKAGNGFTTENTESTEKAGVKNEKAHAEEIGVSRAAGGVRTI
jgi:hypothetical protein